MTILQTCRLLLLGVGFSVAGRFALGQTTLTIQLQNAPNNMEPVDQPKNIRVDDRSPVRLRLLNISPTDICTVTRTPTPNAETNPFESMVTAISGLGAVAIGTSTAAGLPAAGTVSTLLDAHALRTPAVRVATPKPLEDDPIYKRFLDAVTPYDVSARRTIAIQATIQTRFDAASKAILDYLGADYRGALWASFEPRSAAALNDVRALFQNPLDSVTPASSNQSDLDELAGWAAYLHKTYEDPTKYTSAVLIESLNTLQSIDKVMGREKALMVIITDNNTALKAAQSSLRTAYMAVVKIKDDFERRKDQRIVNVLPPAPGGVPVLYQDFNLGTDRKSTVTGTLSCLSGADGKTPTTDTINYSINYQDVPTLSASVGLLTSFLEKEVIGTTSVATTTAGVASSNTIFAITDRARAQIIPMAYLNCRLGSYKSYKSVPWGRTKEGELAITFHMSAGFGVNPNSGTPQPEFFIGPSVGFNRLMMHVGAHFGRTQSLGGGFVLNSTVPATFTGNPPIVWSYHPMISIGFSVRAAPY